MLPIVISDLLVLYGWGVALWSAALAAFTAILLMDGRVIWAIPLGLLALLPAGAVLWAEGAIKAARVRAVRAGLKCAFILGPPGFLSRTLGRHWFRRKGLYPSLVGELALRRWLEIHVDTRRRWPNVQAYREALGQDILALRRRAADEWAALTFSTFVQVPAETLAEGERLAPVTVLAGPLRPWQPGLWTPGRHATVQRRMFGDLVATPGRTESSRWRTLLIMQLTEGE